MRVCDLVRVLTVRADHKDRPVVVEVGKGGLIQVTGVRAGHKGVVVLTLWKPGDPL